MFKLSQSPSYWTVVTVEVRNDQGTPVKCDFDAQFRRLTQAELDEVYERINTGKLDDQGLINEVLVGWRRVLDDNDQEMAFTPDNLLRAMAVHPARPATVEAFFRSIIGARRKN